MTFIVRWIAVLAMMLGVAAAAPSASATTPGTDGLITFVRASQVYTINAVNGSAVRLTSSGRNSAPEWSPNGSMIAYLHQAGKRRDIWVMAADGSNKHAVTTSGRVTMGPAWSPDGTRIAFADGTNRLMWVNVAQPGLGTPFLGYYTGPWGDDVPENAAAMYINPNAERALAADQLAYGEVEFDLGTSTTLPSAVVYAPLAYHRNGDGGPAPSPSGQFIAVTNSASGTPTIFVQKLDGSGRRQLTTGTQPDWQHR
jgi:hypothetical protein